MSNKLKISFWAILILILMNFGTVFAVNITETGLEIVISKYQNLSNIKSNSNYNTIISYLTLYDNCYIFGADFRLSSFNHRLYLYFSNENATKDSKGYYLLGKGVLCTIGSVSSSTSNSIVITNYESYKSIYNIGYVFLGGETYLESGDLIYNKGYENIELLKNEITIKNEKPYFEYNDIFSGEFTVNGTKIKILDYQNLNKTTYLGKLYLDTSKDVWLVQMYERDEDWSTIRNHDFADMYREGTIINGRQLGYLYIDLENVNTYDVLNNYDYEQLYRFYCLGFYYDDGIYQESDYFFITQKNENGDYYLPPIAGAEMDKPSGDKVEDEMSPQSFIDKILQGIAGLFIPQDENYFSNYFSELNDWFSERLGLLYYPIDLLLEFFERCKNIDFENQIISIGPYTLPLNDDFELVPKIEFDFKTFVEDENIGTVYGTYLIVVDGLIVFGLVKLIQIKYEEVFGG